ncbi:MAG: DNA replication and repair protein RecF [Bacteroidales bacterium]|nr:DNA replication and repair protein RecF [Candidatus Cacconaster merdequi]
MNMFLTRIILENFKNIRSAELEFSDKINCISGKNGAGKTNLLDAVYYLSMTKSFFSSSDQYVCEYDADEATLCGFYKMEDNSVERIACQVRKGAEKTFKRGAKTYARFSEHIGLLPVVMVSPVDSALINDYGEERRKYMNFILSQTDKDYLRHIQAYNQLLQQRNRLLKEQQRQDVLVDTVSERMAPHASYVFEARKNLCSMLQPLVRDFYSRLSGGTESASISYKSDLYAGDILGLFLKEKGREDALHYTTVGVQRDDMSFELNGYPIRRCGSQGQQKCFLLAMKLAQFHFMKRIYGQTPMLMLDDVFDKLDMSRVEDLLKIVSTLDFGQIFITDCNKVRLDDVARRLGAPCRSFAVDAGRISEIC